MLINAVFEGGGVKGISLVGAVRSAEQKGVQFHRVAGTSSGSIVASLIAAGYNAEEMKKIIQQTPFSSFMQRSPIFNIGLIGPAVRLLLKKGLYSGEALENWIRQILEAKGVRTFGDLEPGQLRIIASDISNGKLLVLPHDISNYGIDPNKFEVAKAIRMSTSIPYFFDPVMIRENHAGEVGKGAVKPFSKQFVYIVDGGLLSNFPLWLFDREPRTSKGKMIPTVGFQMVGRGENQPHPVRGPITMLQAIFETMMSAHDERYIEEHNRFRTIKIPTLGVSTTQFDISPDMAMKLYDSGFVAASRFFDRWSYSAYENQFHKYRLDEPSIG